MPDDRDWTAQQVVPDSEDYVGRKRYWENNSVLPWTDKEPQQRAYMNIARKALRQQDQEALRRQADRANAATESSRQRAAGQEELRKIGRASRRRGNGRR